MLHFVHNSIYVTQCKLYSVATPGIIVKMSLSPHHLLNRLVTNLWC